MTLADLYNSIDWSGVEGAHAEWLEHHPESQDKVDSAFVYKFRCGLLFSALYDEEQERRAFARSMLRPVLPSIQAILLEENMVLPDAPEDAPEAETA